MRDATRFGPIAPQTSGILEQLASGGQPDTSEDCLFLNVFTPALDDARRPVMVWIHGGGFTGGAGSIPWYDGGRFARHGDVVVVTINYRLGALGFLHLDDTVPDLAGSGRNGIRDQIAALAWVRDNIAAFGGDPGCVTVFGESAGAMSIGTLLAMPDAAGLFHRAVLQSGAGANVFRAPEAARVAELLATAAAVPSVADLVELPADALVAAGAAVQATMLANPGEVVSAGGLALALPFQPVIDGVELPDLPERCVAAGSAAGVTVLAGTTRDEWNLFHLMSPGALDDERLSRRFVEFHPGGVDAETAYRAAYPDRSLDALWCQALTDAVFRGPCQRLLDAQAAHRDDTRGYEFSWATPIIDGKLGSCHALEIPFVWDMVDRRGTQHFTGPDAPQGLADAMSGAWRRFALTGDPNGEGLDPWPTWDPAAPVVADFDTEPVVRPAVRVVA